MIRQEPFFSLPPNPSSIPLGSPLQHKIKAALNWAPQSRTLMIAYLNGYLFSFFCIQEGIWNSDIVLSNNFLNEILNYPKMCKNIMTVM